MEEKRRLLDFVRYLEKQEWFSEFEKNRLYHSQYLHPKEKHIIDYIYRLNHEHRLKDLFTDSLYFDSKEWAVWEKRQEEYLKWLYHKSDK